jgi:hypothetical protein
MSVNAMITVSTDGSSRSSSSVSTLGLYVRRLDRASLGRSE